MDYNREHEGLERKGKGAGEERLKFIGMKGNV
jgi:hypothetical protein